MLSRVLRATPRTLSGVASRRALHASTVRRDIIQDLYTQEIKSFKPRQLTEKDAEGAVLKWSTPATAKAPSEDINISDLDSYASSPVEVEEGGHSEAEADAPTGGDWFPIESFDAQDAAH